MIRTLRSLSDVDALATVLRHRKLPVTVHVESGRKRSTPQNRTAFLWYGEIAEQLGDRTRDDVRAEAKLTLGIPILREDEAFKARYDAVVRGLPYETKLALMVEPFDFPVSRLMSVDQMTRYLDAIQRKYCPTGVVLTEPR